jgi:hypothetical protein
VIFYLSLTLRKPIFRRNGRWSGRWRCNRHVFSRQLLGVRRGRFCYRTSRCGFPHRTKRLSPREHHSCDRHAGTAIHQCPPGSPPSFLRGFHRSHRWTRTFGSTAKNRLAAASLAFEGNLRNGTHASICWTRFPCDAILLTKRQIQIVMCFLWPDTGIRFLALARPFRSSSEMLNETNHNQSCRRLDGLVFWARPARKCLKMISYF